MSTALLVQLSVLSSALNAAEEKNKDKNKRVAYTGENRDGTELKPKAQALVTMYKKAMLGKGKLTTSKIHVMLPNVTKTNINNTMRFLLVPLRLVRQTVPTYLVGKSRMFEYEWIGE